MTLGNFADMQEVALELIAENGERATLKTRVTAAAADPLRPHEPGAVTFVDEVVDAVFLPTSTPGGFTRARGPEGNLSTKQEQEVFAVGTITADPQPNVTEIVRVSGERWEVVAVEVLQPNEDRILYRFLARR